MSYYEFELNKKHILGIILVILSIFGLSLSINRLVVNIIAIALEGGGNSNIPDNSMFLTFLGDAGNSISLTHTHSIGFSYTDARASSTVTTSATTFSDVLTKAAASSLYQFAGYATCYTNTTGGIYGLRFYDKTAAVVAQSPHPTAEYQIGEDSQIVTNLIGVFAFSIPIGSHTYAVQVRRVSGAISVTCINAGVTFFVRSINTGQSSSIDFIPPYWYFPSVETELFGVDDYRLQAKLDRVTQARLIVDVITAAPSGLPYELTTDPNPWMAVQYSIDNGVTWIDLCGANSITPAVNVGITGLRISNFCSINVKQDVILRIIGRGGDDGTEAITSLFSLITVELRA